MYVWVILATFITAIYAFNLSVRSDMRELYKVPQAEAAISKIVIQHRGARKYVQDHMPPDNGTDVVSYFPGQIPYDDLKDYLPFGFNNDKDDSEYTSTIYCLNKESANLSAEVPGCAAGGSGASCCTNSKAATYLITYGCIPSRWRNVFTGKPDNDLLNAIDSVVGIGVSMGYAVDATAADYGSTDVIKSTMKIRGKEYATVAIPQFIISTNQASAGNKSFATVCGDKRNKTTCPYCLVYMTPYY